MGMMVSTIHRATCRCQRRTSWNCAVSPRAMPPKRRSEAMVSLKKGAVPALRQIRDQAIGLRDKKSIYSSIQ